MKNFIKLWEEWESDEDWQEPDKEDLVSSGIDLSILDWIKVQVKLDPENWFDFDETGDGHTGQVRVSRAIVQPQEKWNYNHKYLLTQEPVEIYLHKQEFTRVKEVGLTIQIYANYRWKEHPPKYLEECGVTWSKGPVPFDRANPNWFLATLAKFNELSKSNDPLSGWRED